MVPVSWYVQNNSHLHRSFRSSEWQGGKVLYQEPWKFKSGPHFVPSPTTPYHLPTLSLPKTQQLTRTPRPVHPRAPGPAPTAPAAPFQPTQSAGATPSATPTGSPTTRSRTPMALFARVV